VWIKLKLFCKEKYTFRRAILVFFLFLLLLLVAIFNSLGFLVEWGVVRMAKASGYEDFDLKVTQVDPWVTTIENLHGLNDISIEEIKARYDPGLLALRKINSLSISGLSTNMDFENDQDKQEADKTLLQEVKEILNEVLENPPINFIRLRNSDISIPEHNITSYIELAKIDLFENQIFINLEEMAINELTPFLKIFLTMEGDDHFLSSKINLGDASILFDEFSKHRGIKKMIPNGFEINGGHIGVDVFSRLSPSSFEDVFLELNASEIDFSYFDYNISLPKLMVFLELDDPGKWKSNSYFNFVYEKDILATGVKVTTQNENEGFSIGGEIAELITSEEFYDLNFTGLRFPSLFFDPVKPLQVPINKVKKFSFDEIHYEGDFFRLYEGSLALTFFNEHTLHISVPVLNANLLQFGVSFDQFSYNGTLDLKEFPAISFPQTISGHSLNLADELELSNLALSFRAADMSHFMIDMLALTAHENRVELNPANMHLEFPSDNPQKLTVEFNKASLFLPDIDLSLLGLSGKISLNSVNPLETNGTQSITFDKLQFGEYEFVDGNFSFELKSDGMFIIKDSNAIIYDGVLGLFESEFNLFGDEVNLVVKIKDMDGQKVVDLFRKIDANINGNFSGRIPISKNDGKWNFEEGFMELEIDLGSNLSYDAKGLLTEGIEAGTTEYRRMQLAEKALKNLSLDFFRISFMVDEESRKIRGSIIGESIMEDGREIFLDYRPNTVAGLDEIIQYLNSKN
jgi:hypothetical protein